jgi:hypothetical protein
MRHAFKTTCNSTCNNCGGGGFLSETSVACSSPLSLSLCVQEEIAWTATTNRLSIITYRAAGTPSQLLSRQIVSFCIPFPSRTITSCNRLRVPYILWNEVVVVVACNNNQRFISSPYSSAATTTCSSSSSLLACMHSSFSVVHL